MIRLLNNCKSPGCGNSFFADGDANYVQASFCPDCRDAHSAQVLKTQIEHSMPIRELLLDAKVFRTATGMSDYFGVSFVTVYHWIRRYFGMTFQEFRREYICKTKGCYAVDISGSKYNRVEYLLKKIKDNRHCACLSEAGKQYVLTNTPLDKLRKILKVEPKICDLHAKTVKPEPMYYLKIEPIYFLNDTIQP